MLRVRTTFTGLSGSPYLNTFYFLGTAEDQAEANAANGHVGTFWNAMEGGFSNQLTWATEGVVDKLGVDGVLTNSFAVTAQSGVGAETGDPLPHSNQLLIRWSTGTFANGRERKGRTFVPGLTELNSSNGVVTTSTINLLQPAVDALNAAVNPSLAIWSRPRPLEDPPFGGAASSVAGGTIWNQFAVLRSRRD